MIMKFKPGDKVLYTGCQDGKKYRAEILSENEPGHYTFKFLELTGTYKNWDPKIPGAATGNQFIFDYTDGPCLCNFNRPFEDNCLNCIEEFYP